MADERYIVLFVLKLFFGYIISAPCYPVLWYGIVEFNVPLDTV